MHSAGTPTTPAIEVTFMIIPFLCFLIVGKVSLIVLIAPKRFVSNCFLLLLWIYLLKHQINHNLHYLSKCQFSSFHQVFYVLYFLLNYHIYIEGKTSKGSFSL